MDVTAKGKPFAHYWSLGVGAGRVNEGLRAAWHEQLARAKAECGFRYVRMHDTFNDDMFVYLKDVRSGKVTLNFQYIDEVYDRMLAEGVRSSSSRSSRASWRPTEPNGASCGIAAQQAVLDGLTRSR